MDPFLAELLTLPLDALVNRHTAAREYATTASYVPERRQAIKTANVIEAIAVYRFSQVTWNAAVKAKAPAGVQ